MKYGAHLYLWEEQVDDAHLRPAMDRAAALGLDFLEIPIGDDVRFDPAAIGEAARQRRLELVLSPGALWPAECDLSLPEPALRQRALAWHREAVARCAACGAVAYTGALYGHPGRVLRTRPPAAESQWVAEGLAALAETGAACGVKVVIEPMSHFRTHVANTPAQVSALLAAAAHPNLYSLLDTYHLSSEINHWPAAVAAMAPHLWGLHACDNQRGVPGSGFLPWAEITGALRAAAWQGYVGFESYNSALRDGEFARSRGMFHGVCPDGDAFVRQGLAFLRALLNI